ncbi:MAG TPA: hypothetical protein VHP58_00655 [Alphaproteobacteria bacterium]|nr:hypothetical protein [Alphaproteobacteria bacterium]
MNGIMVSALALLLVCSSEMKDDKLQKLRSDEAKMAEAIRPLKFKPCTWLQEMEVKRLARSDIELFNSIGSQPSFSCDSTGRAKVDFGGGATTEYEFLAG